jgi:hypothetical protein
LCGEEDKISELRRGRLRWVRLVERMSEEGNVKKVFKNIPEGKWSVEKPRKRWLDDVENGTKKMDVKDWSKLAKDKHAW